MKITHVSAECFPIAKVGGLADVVGALPKYQNEIGVESNVIMPFYKNAFTQNNTFEKVYKSEITLGGNQLDFTVLKLKNNTLGFDLFCIDIPQLLYKDYVYSSEDTERFLSFQMAVLDWFLTLENLPDIIHVHDHHTGLIPFMMGQSHKYSGQ